jgi:hypothetical protein
MIFTLGLFIYHSSLIWRNLTTKEELKSSFRNIYDNPYDRGLCGNIKKILCPRLNYYDIIDKIREKIYNKIINNQLIEKKEKKDQIYFNENQNPNQNKNQTEKLEGNNFKEKVIENINENEKEKENDNDNEERINSVEKISGINKTNPESEEYKNNKKREEIYCNNDNENHNDNENENNIENIIDDKDKDKDNNSQIEEKKEKDLDKDKCKDNDKDKELCNSQIKIIFPKDKIDKINSNEKSIDFNLQQSMEINQEGIFKFK